MVWLSYAPSLVLFPHTSCHSCPATTPVMRAESLIPLQPDVHKASFWHTEVLNHLINTVDSKQRRPLHYIIWPTVGTYMRYISRYRCTYKNTVTRHKKISFLMGFCTLQVWVWPCHGSGSYTSGYHPAWVSVPCKSECDHAMAQAVTHQVITLHGFLYLASLSVTLPWLRQLHTRLSPCTPRFNPRPTHVAHVVKSSTGTGFSMSTSPFTCQYHSTNLLFSLIHVSPPLYNLSNWQNCSITHLNDTFTSENQKS
jgi:hypothetical protein